MVPDKKCSRLKMSDAIDWHKPPKFLGSLQEFGACSFLCNIQINHAKALEEKLIILSV